jgi:hypothetical protein
MGIWNYAIRLYYALKTYYDGYFKNTDDLLTKTLSKEHKIDDPKIIELENEIKILYKKIDIKYVYNCLYVINKDYNETSGLNEIINFLEVEGQFILQNKDNLEISLNKIKENTYVLELISKFKLLEEIREKEVELNKLKKIINNFQL